MYLAKSLAEKLYLFQVIVGPGGEEGKVVVEVQCGEGARSPGDLGCVRMALSVLMVGFNSLSFPDEKARQPRGRATVWLKLFPPSCQPLGQFLNRRASVSLFAKW